MSQKEMYSPCPCGSGKKYKFCCYLKRSEQTDARSLAQFWSGSDSDTTEDNLFLDFDLDLVDKIMKINEKGLRLMNKGEYEKALPYFKKAMPLSKDVYTAANNLALCLFVTGDLDQAIRVQEKSLEASCLINPFGTVNLATFYYFKGDESTAKRLLDEAVGMETPSPEACAKVCEGLARFKRHRDILNYLDGTEFANTEHACFYAGVAAANLGDKKRAIRELKKVSFGYHKADTVRRYLRELQDGSPPHTVFGDWPYLALYEIFPEAFLESVATQKEDVWFSRRIYVDTCEVFLNATADDPADALTMLRDATHPDAVVLLEKIVDGRFGPDSLRMEAVLELQKRGAIDLKKPVKMFVNGEYKEMNVAGTLLNPEYNFADPLPPKWAEIFRKAFREGRDNKNPNWNAIGNTYLKIIEAVPEFFPARYNYVVTLMSRHRYEEAEPILNELIEQHPEYLFAPATLLQILCLQDRMDEAKALVKNTRHPEETHPDAMVAWALAQVMYYKCEGSFDEAEKCIRYAYQIAPDHPHAKALWKSLED